MPPALQVLRFLMFGAGIVAFLIVGVLLFVNGHPWWGVFWFCGVGELVMWPVSMAGWLLLSFLVALGASGRSDDRRTEGTSATTARRAKLWCALAAFALLMLMGLFPPWSTKHGRTVYSPVFSRPPYREWVPKDSDKWERREYSRPEDPGYWEEYGVAEIDLTRLLVQFLIVGFASGGAIVLVGLLDHRRRAPE